MDVISQVVDVVESERGQHLFDVLECAENRVLISPKHGEGTMFIMQPFEGMVLSRYVMKTSGFKLSTAGVGEGLKLNWCTAGRLEASMRGDRFLYVAPGDLSVETDTAVSFSFPCGFYRGIELFLPEAFLLDPPPLFADAGLDLRSTLATLCPSVRLRNWVRRASDETARILSELSCAPSRQWPARERLLVAELLLQLSYEGAPLRETETTIYTKSQVECAKRVHDLLCGNLAQRRSIESVAAELDVGATTLKAWFAGVYGSSISVFLREARMEEAKRLLAEERDPIADVARRVGYANPGKFAAVFKEHVGQTPRAWRASKS